MTTLVAILLCLVAVGLISHLFLYDDSAVTYNPWPSCHEIRDPFKHDPDSDYCQLCGGLSGKCHCESQLAGCAQPADTQLRSSQIGATGFLKTGSGEWSI